MLHPKARTDDSHAAPLFKISILIYITTLLKKKATLVRLLVYCRIESHPPPSLQTPANYFKFYPCGCNLQAR